MRRARRGRTSHRFLELPLTSRSRKRLPRSILPPRCRSLIWSGWPAPSTDRALEERLAAHIARKVPVWLALEAPVTVDGVEPWRAALQGLLTRHREGIAILEIRGWRRLEAHHVCGQTGLHRSAVRARVDTGRAQWHAAVIAECARRSLHVGPRAVCRSPGAFGDGRPGRRVCPPSEGGS